MLTNHLGRILLFVTLGGSLLLPYGLHAQTGIWKICSQTSTNLNPPRRICFQVGWTVSSLGFGGLRDSSRHGASAIFLRSHEDVRQGPFPGQDGADSDCRINALVFRSVAYQSVGKQDRDPVGPLSGRAAGLISILLWFGLATAGRRIAYV
jgi:hypothetical protein